jgi:hypothetical protein
MPTSALCSSVDRPPLLTHNTLRPPAHTQQSRSLHTQVVAPLGPSSVALAASTQLTPQRLLVDEYYRSGGGYVLAHPAAELGAYLHRRCVLRGALVWDLLPVYFRLASCCEHST